MTGSATGREEPSPGPPGPDSPDDLVEHPGRPEPGVRVLGIEAPAPRFALTVVWTVLTAFLTMQIVNILDESVTPLTVSLCLTVLPATIGLQLFHTLPRFRRSRARYRHWTLLLQALLVTVPPLFLGWPWGGMGASSAARCCCCCRCGPRCRASAV